MELERNPIVGNLMAQVDEQHDRLAAQTETLPRTREEYMGLPLGQRMDLARNITSTYAVFRGGYSDAPTGDWPASLVIPASRDDVVLDVRVAYRPEAGRPTYGDDYEILKYPDINVWARARNTASGLKSGFNMIGSVIFGPYKVDDGTRYGQWIRETHAEVLRPQPRQLSGSVRTEMPLDHPDAYDLIEVVDEATIVLIEGVVARHRSLGRSAILLEPQE